MTASILCIDDEPAVGAFLERTLTRAGYRVVLVSSVELAVPLVARWYLEDLGWTAAVGVVAVAVTGVAVTRWFGSSLTAVRFALLALVLLVLFRWVLP